MMDDIINSSKMGKLFYTLMVALNFVLVSFTLSQLATWFITPVSLVQAMGINVLWTFYAVRGPKFVKEALVQTDLYNRLITSYAQSLTALLIGLALSFFV